MKPFLEYLTNEQIEGIKTTFENWIRGFYYDRFEDLSHHESDFLIGAIFNDFIKKYKDLMKEKPAEPIDFLSGLDSPEVYGGSVSLSEAYGGSASMSPAPDRIKARTVPEGTCKRVREKPLVPSNEIRSPMEVFPCPICNSSVIKNFLYFGKLRCTNPECQNHEKYTGRMK